MSTATEAGGARKHGQIHGKMLAILDKVGPIDKDQTNEFHKFKFRGIDSVYDRMHPLLKEFGVYMQVEILNTKREDRTNNDKPATWTFMTVRYKFTAEDGSTAVVEAVGEGMDAGNSDKSAAKAMSMAYKTMMFQAFSIPMKLIDGDADPGPDEKPDPNMPNTPPRGQRQPSAEKPVVGLEVLSSIKKEWMRLKNKLADDKDVFDEFVTWARGVVFNPNDPSRQFNPRDVRQWTEDDVNACDEALMHLEREASDAS